MLEYILTMRDGSKERWSVNCFNAWVVSQGERIGTDFKTRLNQFRRYTGQDVVDWEME